jgi:hypothetical protein
MSKKPKRQTHLMDFLTSLLLTIAAVVGLYFFHIFQEPLSVLNPFPPIEEPIALPEDLISQAITKTLGHLPTTTPIPSSFPETQQIITPTATLFPTKINTIEPLSDPTNTPDPEKIIFSYVTPTGNVDEIFYTPTARPIADYLFDFALMHEPQPQASPWNDFVANPILNCNWFGVGGQVFDYHGNPMIGANIKLGGTFPDSGEFVELYAVTEYEHVQGIGGYEFKLSDKPLETSSFWVQVIDENGFALSAKAHFTITPHCTINLIRIDFTQVK